MATRQSDTPDKDQAATDPWEGFQDMGSAPEDGTGAWDGFQDIGPAAKDTTSADPWAGFSDAAPDANTPDTAPVESDWSEVLTKSFQNIPTRWSQAVGGMESRLGETDRVLANELANAGEDMASSNYLKKVIGAGEMVGSIPGLIRKGVETFSLSDERQAALDRSRAELSAQGRKTYDAATAKLKANQPTTNHGTAKYYTGAAIEGALGSLAPVVAASVITRNPKVGLSLMGTYVYGAKYDEQVSAGRDPAEAAADAFYYALAETLTETGPLSIIMKPGTKFLKRAVGGTLSEGGQEMLNEALQLGYDMGILDKDTTLKQAIWRVVDAGIIGSMAGGAVTMAAHPYIASKEETAYTTPDGEFVTPADKVAVDLLNPDRAQLEQVNPNARPLVQVSEDEIVAERNKRLSQKLAEPDATIDDVKEKVKSDIEVMQVTGTDPMKPAIEAPIDAAVTQESGSTPAVRIPVNVPEPAGEPKPEEPTSEDKIIEEANQLAEERDKASKEALKDTPVQLDVIRKKQEDTYDGAVKMVSPGRYEGTSDGTPILIEKQGKQWVASIDGEQAATGKTLTAAKAELETVLTGNRKAAAATTQDIEEKANEAATSPENNLPEPTDAQIEAGNYKKGHISVSGLDITVENPKGSTRSGTGPDGKKWTVTMKSHYGYFKRTTGADGEQIDTFVGENPEAPTAWVINQIDPTTGKFDEHKVMLGFNSEEAARKGYLENYNKGWKGLDSIEEVPVADLQSWLDAKSEEHPAPAKPATTAEQEKDKARYNELRDELRPLVEKGSLTKAESEQYQAIVKELDGIMFRRSKPATEKSLKGSAKERKSTLTPAVNAAAFNAKLADEGIYMALASAAAGTEDNAHTAVDDIMEGKNSSVTPEQLYDAFGATRDALRAEHGDTITLYRAEGKQMEKPTKNWATTREFAEQFGDNVVTKEVPIDDIIAVNVNRNGRYHEVIVGKRPGVTEPSAIKYDQMEVKRGRHRAVVDGKVMWIKQDRDRSDVYHIGAGSTGILHPSSMSSPAEAMKWFNRVVDVAREKGITHQAAAEIVSKELAKYYEDLHAKESVDTESIVDYTDVDDSYGNTVISPFKPKWLKRLTLMTTKEYANAKAADMNGAVPTAEEARGGKDYNSFEDFRERLKFDFRVANPEEAEIIAGALEELVRLGMPRALLTQFAVGVGSHIDHYDWNATFVASHVEGQRDTILIAQGKMAWIRDNQSPESRKMVVRWLAHEIGHAVEGLNSVDKSATFAIDGTIGKELIEAWQFGKGKLLGDFLAYPLESVRWALPEDPSLGLLPKSGVDILTREIFAQVWAAHRTMDRAKLAELLPETMKFMEALDNELGQEDRGITESIEAVRRKIQVTPTGSEESGGHGGSLQGSAEVRQEDTGTRRGRRLLRTRQADWARITAEAVPSTQLGYDFTGLPPDLMAEYHKRSTALIHNGAGENLALKALGLNPIAEDVTGTGGYQGALNPNMIINVPDGDTANLASAVLTYIYSQDAVPWFKPLVPGEKEDGYVVDAVKITFPFHIDTAMEQALLDGLVEQFGVDEAGFTRFSETEIIVLDYNSNVDFKKKMRAITEELNSEGIKSETTRAQTAYPEVSWAPQEREATKRVLEDTLRSLGRPTLYSWAHRIRARQEALNEEYGHRQEVAGSSEPRPAKDNPEVLKVFNDMATQQRGAPEEAMLDVQHLAGGGVLNPVVEHVGDLTNRMSKDFHITRDMGRGYVEDKAHKTRRALENGYGFEREMEENLKANYQTGVLKYAAKGRKALVDLIGDKTDISFPEYRKMVSDLLRAYADAHRQLPVYNRAQWTARQAAIMVGTEKWDLAAAHLQKLEDWAQSQERWQQVAETYTPDADGTPAPYEPSLAGSSEPAPAPRSDKNFMPPSAMRKATMEIVRGDNGRAMALPFGYTPGHTGLDSKPLVMLPKNVRKVLTGVHKGELSMEAFSNVPGWMQRPLFVFDSATKPGAVVVVLRQKGNSGEHIMLSIDPDVPVGRTRANEITSIYERPDDQIANWIRKGLLKAADTEEGNRWAEKAPVQFRGMSAHLKRSIAQSDRIASPEIAGMADPEQLTLFKLPELPTEPAPMFYYKMRNVLDAKLPGKSTPAMYSTVIKNLAKKGEFKQEELNDSGIIEWLDNQTPERTSKPTAKLSKAEVVSWMDANQIQLVEVEHNEASVKPDADVPDIDYVFWTSPEYIQPEEDQVTEETDYFLNEVIDEEDFPAENYDSESERQDAMQEEAETLARASLDETASFEFTDDSDLGYRIIGNNAYGTFDLYINGEFISQFATAEEAKDNAQTEMLDRGDARIVDDEHDGIRFGSYRLEGGENPREIYLTLPSLEGKGFSVPVAHATGDNVVDTQQIVRIRVDDRTGPYGEKILHIDEVQDDLHKKGSEIGYRPDNLEGRLQYLREERDKLYAKAKPATDEGKDAPRDIIEEVTKISDAIDALEKRRGEGVPDAPFKKSAKMLGVKRMIRYAAENGYDILSWTSGQQQADRYSLSRVASKLTYSPGTGEFRAFDKNGNVVHSAILTKDQLVQNVGKGLAQRLLDDAEKKNEGPDTAQVRIEELEGDWGLVSKETGKVIRSFPSRRAAKADLLEHPEAMESVVRPSGFMIERVGLKLMAISKWEVVQTNSSGGVLYANFFDIKDAAEKQAEILREQHRKDKGTGVVEGEELKLGGEALKAIYDRVLPTQIGKYIKRWGQKVGETTVETEPGKREGVHAIDITDAMRHDVVYEGQDVYGVTDPESVADGNLGPLPKETFGQRKIRMFQDSFNRISTLQAHIIAKGGTVNALNDVYRTEERSSGITANMLDKFDKEMVIPLMANMRARKLTLEIMDKYLEAKHALERNEVIAAINPDMPDGGSGMLNADAEAVLEEMAKAHNIDDIEMIADIVYEVNRRTRKTLLDAGLINQDTFDMWEKQFKYYVPLRGLQDVNETPGSGSGTSVKSSGIRRMLGRGAQNRAKSPLVYSISQAEEAIVRSQKVEVGRAMLLLMLDNPDTSLWSVTQRQYDQLMSIDGNILQGYTKPPEGLIEDVDYKRTIGPDGTVIYVLDPNYNNRKDVFATMVDGKEYLMTIKDDLVVEQLKKLNSTQLGALVQGAGKVNRYLAAINTALNPEFIFTNFERDFGMALAHIGGKYNAKMAARMAAGIPGAMRGIWQATFDTSGTSEWRSLFEELKEQGGTIGFFGLEDIDTRVKKIQNRLSDAEDGAWATSKRGIKTVRDVVLDANLSVENAARLAAYKVAIDEGMTKADAASLAKNLTVNFNRKGEVAPLLNTTYLFFNASIQGSFLIFKLMKYKKFQAILAGAASVAYMLAMYNMAMGGDDDDGVSHWEKLPDSIKQTHIIFMDPDGSGEYTKFKLPYGINAFYHLGTALHALGHNKSTSATKEALGIVNAFMNAYNPIQGADILDTVTPTVGKPIEQHVRNMNFYGGKIKPEYKFDAYDRPDSDKAFKSTNPQLKDLAKWMNAVTGGDDTTSGLVDWSPEMIKHYTQWITGGAGMTVYRALDTISTAATPSQDLEIRQMPFARTFRGKKGNYYDRERFYDTLSKLEATKAQMRIYADRKEPEARRAYIKKHREEVRVLDSMTMVRKIVTNINNSRRAALDKKDKEKAAMYEERALKRMRDFSKRYAEAIKKDKGVK